MIKKLLASIFLVSCFHAILARIGWPKFGTIGFLLSLNVVHLFLFFSYQTKAKYLRQIWAGVTGVIAILAAIIALFRANPQTQLMLGYLSISLTVITYYFYTLTHGINGNFIDLLLIPANLCWGWLKSIKHFLIDFKPRYLSVGGLLFFILLLLLSIQLGSLSNQTTYSVAGLSWNGYSLSLVLFGLALSLAAVKTLSFLTYRVTLDVLSTAYVEVLLLSGLVLVGMLFASYFKLDQYYFVRDGTSLLKYGFSSISTYVRSGFIEFFVLWVIVYATTELATVVMYLSKKNGLALRSICILMLLTLLIPLSSVTKRFVWYVSTFGLTQSRLYGAIIIFTAVLFIVIVTARFIFNIYHRLKLVEFALFVLLILLTSILNLDQLIAMYYLRDVPKKQANYLKVTQLSADSVVGWVDSYFHVKDSLLEANLSKEFAEGTPEHEQIVLLKDALTNLRLQYLKLAIEYGTTNDVYILSLNTSTKSINAQNTLLQQLAIVNLAKWNAYRVLNEQISPQELVQLEKMAENVLASKGTEDRLSSK